MGILLLEAVDPAGQQFGVIAGDGGRHNDDSILRAGGCGGLRGLVVLSGSRCVLLGGVGGFVGLIIVPAAGGQAQDHTKAEKQCKKLFHIDLLDASYKSVSFSGEGANLSSGNGIILQGQNNFVKDSLVG